MRNLIGFVRAYISDLKYVLSGNVGVMALSWFLFALSSAMVMPFFSLYAKRLGAGDLEISIIRSIGLIALALFLPLGGLLTDLWGRVKPIIIGTTLVSIVQFLYAVAPDWRFLAAVWVVDNASHFYQPALTAIVMDSMPRDKTMKGFMLLNVFSSIPWLFMPIVGGVLYDIYGVTGIRFGFVFSGVIALVVTILRIKTLHETLSPRNKDLSSVILELAGYRPILNKAMKYYLYTAFFNQLTLGVINTFGAIYAINRLGMDAASWGVATTIGSASSILTSLVLTARISLHSKGIIVLSSILIAVSQLTYAIPYVSRELVPLVYLSASISSIGGAVIGASISSILTHILPPELRGRATGIQRTLETLGGALASYVAGLMYTFLNPFNSLLVSFVIGLVATWYIFYIT
ncbi:MFS transporter [Thermogladius sp. 4427co]|uniref:MFS transporter n=1 Tax=Thermogladius sp. 4427co TaxID=3450718 RepID=UPI003F7913C8